jgi:hypothetical protein
VSPNKDVHPRPPVTKVVTVDVPEVVNDDDRVADAVEVPVEVADAEAVLMALVVPEELPLLVAVAEPVELAEDDADVVNVDVSVEEGDVCSQSSKSPLLRSATAWLSRAISSVHLELSIRM